MTKYRVGIIGCGRIASTIDDEVVNSDHLLPYSHTASYMEVEQTFVVAAADVHEARLVAWVDCGDGGRPNPDRQSGH